MVRLTIMTVVCDPNHSFEIIQDLREKYEVIIYCKEESI